MQRFDVSSRTVRYSGDFFEFRLRLDAAVGSGLGPEFGGEGLRVDGKG